MESKRKKECHVICIFKKRKIQVSLLWATKRAQQIWKTLKMLVPNGKKSTNNDRLQKIIVFIYCPKDTKANHFNMEPWPSG